MIGAHQCRIASPARSWAVAAGTACLLVSIARAQTTYHVNGTCGDDAWTGLSQTCSAPNGPKLTIQAGIDASANGDTVIVADGTYTDLGNKNLDYGGRIITLRSENGAAACIIDCEDDGRGFSFDHDETADAVLDGFTIRNGNVGNENGGAIRCESASPTILNCVLANNRARQGGGLSNYLGHPTISNCAISENESSSLGGGMQNDRGDATITSCTFVGNFGSAILNLEGSLIISDGTFRENTSIMGGGIFNMGSLTLTNCEFTDNTSTYMGGGIADDGDSVLVGCTFYRNAADSNGGGMYSTRGPTLADCTFRGNSAGGGGGIYAGAGTTLTDCTFRENSGQRGGGMWSQGSSSLTNCTFIDNSAVFDGGGLILIRGQPTVTNCTFSENSAGSGGGIYAWDANPAVTHCTFTGNLADSGGGLFNFSSTSSVTNCAFSGNSADSGGGVFNEHGILAVTNCTISGNSAVSGAALFNTGNRADAVVANCILWNDGSDEVVEFDGAVTAVRFSDIQGGWQGPGRGNIDAAPLFVDPANGDYRVASGSPCIDAARNARVPASITTDLDHNARFVDDPATPDCQWLPGTCGDPPIVDMGAYEFQGPCDPCDMNCDGDVNALDIETFIELLFAGGEPCAVCTGDVNGDGNIDALDIELFIACLFP